MMIVGNFVVHYSFVGFRQESSRDGKETTTGWILSNYLLPTVYHSQSHFIKWGHPTSVLSMELEVVEVVDVVEVMEGVVITLIPVSVEMVRAVWLQGGERTGLWLRAGLAAGQVRSVQQLLVTGESYMVAVVVLLLHIPSPVSRVFIPSHPVNSQHTNYGNKNNRDVWRFSQTSRW